MLACTLFVGGVLAPLSHLVYMAVSDMYAPMHEAIDSEIHGACYKDIHDRHEACPYLTLFAAPLIGDLTQPVISLAYNPVVELLPNLPAIHRQLTFFQFHWIRGPPHNS